MAEEKPSLHIDTDWKKQAQEEKRKLAEQEEQKRKAAATSPPGIGVGPGAGPAVGAGGPPGIGATPGMGRGPARGQRGEMPEPSFATMVQSMVTQILFYLGDLAPRGGEPMLNLDMAKHHIDTLTVLEEKTKGNLTEEERRMLDAALYETRMRYVAVASQFTGP